MHYLYIFYLQAISQEKKISKKKVNRETECHSPRDWPFPLKSPKVELCQEKQKKTVQVPGPEQTAGQSLPFSITRLHFLLFPSAEKTSLYVVRVNAQKILGPHFYNQPDLDLYSECKTMLL